MLAVGSKPGVAAGPAGNVPPLENGDSLRSREFLRRYEGKSRIKKAELIEGIVYMGSPVGVRHAGPDAIIEDEQYRVQPPDALGVIESRGFPGLRLPVAALLTGDTAAVLAAVTR